MEGSDTGWIYIAIRHLSYQTRLHWCWHVEMLDPYAREFDFRYIKVGAKALPSLDDLKLAARRLLGSVKPTGRSEPQRGPHDRRGSGRAGRQCQALGAPGMVKLRCSACRPIANVVRKFGWLIASLVTAGGPSASWVPPSKWRRSQAILIAPPAVISRPKLLRTARRFSRDGEEWGAKGCPRQADLGARVWPVQNPPPASSLLHSFAAWTGATECPHSVSSAAE